MWSWTCHVIRADWTYTSNVNLIKYAVWAWTGLRFLGSHVRKVFYRKIPNQICMNMFSGLFSQLLVFAVTRRQWCSRMRRWLPWQTPSVFLSLSLFACRICNINAIIHFLVGSSEICANTYKQTNSFSKASQKQEQIDEHIHTSMWAGDVCTFQVKTIRNRWHFHNVLCVQSSPVLHHDVWTGGNKWNPVSAACFLACYPCQ